MLRNLCLFSYQMGVLGYAHRDIFGGEGDDERHSYSGTRENLEDFETEGRFLRLEAFVNVMASLNYLPIDLEEKSELEPSDIAYFEHQDRRSGRLPIAIRVRRIGGHDFVTIDCVIRLLWGWIDAGRIA